MQLSNFKFGNGNGAKNVLKLNGQRLMPNTKQGKFAHFTKRLQSWIGAI